MIEIQGLIKRYGNHTAVQDITFTVEKGEILGFLGPNGAGKTTTMNILTGYLQASGGTAKVCGYDVSEEPMEVKKRIGYLPESPPLYHEMTVEEYLNFVCELKKVSKKEKKEQIDYVTDMVKISDVRGRVIKNLSKGYKQRVGIAQALIGKPEVLILDEPTVGLDPKQIIEIRELIKRLGEEHTIILSSHILPEVNAVCSRIVIINKGKIVAIDTPENLTKFYAKKGLVFVGVEGETIDVINVLKTIDGVVNVAVVENKDQGSKLSTYEIEVNEDLDIRKPMFFALAKAQYPIFELAMKKATLEDVFLQLTGTQNEVDKAVEEIDSIDEVEDETINDNDLTDSTTSSDNKISLDKEATASTTESKEED